MSRVLPILFNTDMVQAVLDGRKTVTRRVIKPQPGKDMIHKLGYCVDGDKNVVGKFGFGSHECGGNILYVKPSYQPGGDILYVRETWCNANKEGVEPDYYYYADVSICEDYNRTEWKWHPSIHMPKEAARIWLRVTDVRVERLQEIDGSGIFAEGIDNGKSNPAMDKRWENIQRIAFENLWNSTIKEADLDRYGWDANPWVWVIEFERCEKPEN